MRQSALLILLTIVAYQANCDASQCLKGHYYDSKTSACQACPPGSFSPTSGATACQPCEPGYYAYYIRSTSCLIAYAGSYVSAKGATNVELCPKGTYSRYQGAKSIDTCQPCPSGQYSTGGLSSCGLAAAGTYVLADKSGYAKCPAGTYSKAGSMGCQPCEPGYYTTTAGEPYCDAAPAGTYANAERTNYVKCPVGTYSSDEGAASVADCKPCEPGYFAQYEGTQYCRIAYAGTYATNNGAKIAYCPAGTYSEDGAMSVADCKPCEPGYYAQYEGSGSCTIAPPGTYTTGGKMIQCPAGTYSETEGATSIDTCKPCEPGYYNYGGSDSCTIAPTGSYVKNNRELAYCPAGTYSDSQGATSIDACQPCKPGYYSSRGSSYCGIAPAGTYVINNGADISECPSGTKSQEGAKSVADCTACDPGYYLLSEESDSCIIAPAGAYVTNNGVGIAYCPPGTTSNEGSKSSEDCKACEPGYYTRGWGNPSCTIAPAGSYVTYSGAAVDWCPAGTYSDDGAKSIEDCKACEPGFYARSAGSPSCFKAPLGSYVVNNGTSVDWCPSDKTSNSDRTGCVDRSAAVSI